VADPGGIQHILEATKLASRRQVTDILARFRHTGYARFVPNPADRRPRLIRPTGRLLERDRFYVGALFRPLNILYPERGYSLTLAHDAAFHGAFRKAGFLLLPHATSFMQENPLIMSLLAGHAGYLAFLLVVRATVTGTEQGTSFSSIADRLGVSRTHIRMLFADAERDGCVSLDEKGGRTIKILPPLLDAFDRFLGDLESGHDVLGQFALRLMAADRSSSASRTLRTGLGA
jgi:transposase